MMRNRPPPLSDLKRLKKEVLDLEPVDALPSNLPDHWLDMIARDLEMVTGSSGDTADEVGSYASAPLALILRILQGKALDATVSMSHEMLWDYFLDLQIEINLEIVSRRTDRKIEPATLETIFTNRQAQAISAS